MSRSRNYGEDPQPNKRRLLLQCSTNQKNTWFTLSFQARSEAHEVLKMQAAFHAEVFVQVTEVLIGKTAWHYRASDRDSAACVDALRLRNSLKTRWTRCRRRTDCWRSPSQ